MTRTARLIASLAVAAAFMACEPTPQNAKEPAPRIAEDTLHEEALRVVEPVPAEGRSWDQWQIHGALRNVNLHGDVSSRVNLNELFGADGINHGVGAMGGLTGELTLSGERLARAIGGAKPIFEVLPASEELDQEATFFFATRVEEWQEIRLEEAMGREELSDYLESWTAKTGVEGALPFRYEGPFESLEAHVVDISSLPEGGGNSCAERKEASYRFRDNGRTGELVGIFTKNHTSIVVDHTTYLHIHVILDNEHSGHVDDFILPEGAVIHLPSS